MTPDSAPDAAMSPASAGADSVGGWRMPLSALVTAAQADSLGAAIERYVVVWPGPVTGGVAE